MKRYLTTLSVLLFAQAPQGAPVTPENSYCVPGTPRTGKVQLTDSRERLTEKTFKVFWPKEAYFYEKGLGGNIEWRGDVNSDGVDDYLVTTGSNGTAGLEQVLLASCSSGLFAIVFDDYMRTFKVEGSKTSKWKTVITNDTKEHESANCKDSDASIAIDTNSAWEFKNGRYARVRTWVEKEIPKCE